jgi:acetoin utilization deacetylase AcuC-like enzyme
MALTIVASSRFGDHLTPPGHPESPDRAAILDGVAERARSRGVAVTEPREATDAELERVHTPAHIQSIESTRGRAAMLDADTFTSPDTADLARLAAGAAITAVESCLGAQKSLPTSEVASAFALVRPPGHHAESERAMGFCFYSNAAVAAAHARAVGLARVAIVDIDVHHGNGTQAVFYDDPSVLFISTHQYPFYPGTGAAREIGAGPGEGFTANLAMEGGATDGDYQQVIDTAVMPILQQFRPELILVSAGFDAHEDDPLGQMRMTTSGYAWTASRLLAAARHAACPLALVTEGGYALGALSASLDAVCGVLEGGAPMSGEMRPPTGRGERALDALRLAQGARWAGL